MIEYIEIAKIYEKLTDIFLRDDYIELNNGCLITCELNISNHLYFCIHIQFDNDTQLGVFVYSDNETNMCVYNSFNELVKTYNYENFDVDNLVTEIVKKIHKHSMMFFDCLCENK